jgi:hypothetical protein
MLTITEIRMIVGALEGEALEYGYEITGERAELIAKLRAMRDEREAEIRRYGGDLSYFGR